MKIAIILFITLFFISCASEQLSDPTPKNKLIYPAKVLLSNDNSKLFVANSNFDLRYRGASINVIDLKTQKIIPKETKLLDSFLSDIKMDINENLLFVISKDTSKLYAYNISDTSPFLSCNENLNGKCDTSYIQKLTFDTPNSMTLDIDRKLIYIAHRNNASVSIVKYEKKDGIFKFRLLKSFSVSGLTGNTTDIEYNKALDRVFVTSDYTQFVISFMPMMDYYGNINKIKYFSPIKVTNRAVLLSNYTDVEDISFYNDKMFLTMTNPSSISVLTKQKLNDEDSFSFDKSIYTDYFPVKLLCDESSICVASLYQSRKLAIIDLEKGLLLKNINIKKRSYDITYSSIRKEIYITLFIDNSILVLDFDKNSPTYLKIKNLIY